ncbi:hypothetical protein CULT_2380007 [[Clostridium] ultunense Esp]|nr:hypothetical protein CULT_2380007 [[Clostridium] ultunense Esp]
MTWKTITSGGRSVGRRRWRSHSRASERLVNIMQSPGRGEFTPHLGLDPWHFDFFEIKSDF